MVGLIEVSGSDVIGIYVSLRTAVLTLSHMFEQNCLISVIKLCLK